MMSGGAAADGGISWRNSFYTPKEAPQADWQSALGEKHASSGENRVLPAKELATPLGNSMGGRFRPYPGSSLQSKPDQGDGVGKIRRAFKAPQTAPGVRRTAARSGPCMGMPAAPLSLPSSVFQGEARSLEEEGATARTRTAAGAAAVHCSHSWAMDCDRREAQPQGPGLQSQLRSADAHTGGQVQPFSESQRQANLPMLLSGDGHIRPKGPQTGVQAQLQPRHAQAHGHSTWGVKGQRGRNPTLQLRQDSRPHAGGFAGYGRPAVAPGTTDLAGAAFTSGMTHQEHYPSWPSAAAAVPRPPLQARPDQNAPAQLPGPDRSSRHASASVEDAAGVGLSEGDIEGASILMSIKGGSTLMAMSVDGTHTVAPTAPESPSTAFFRRFNATYDFEGTSPALEKLKAKLRTRGLAYLEPLAETWLGYYKKPWSWFLVPAKGRQIRGLPDAVGYLQYLAATHAPGPGQAA